jgi:hypothetical protein
MWGPGNISQCKSIVLFQPGDPSIQHEKIEGDPTPNDQIDSHNKAQSFFHTNLPCYQEREPLSDGPFVLFAFDSQQPGF